MTSQHNGDRVIRKVKDMIEEGVSLIEKALFGEEMEVQEDQEVKILGREVILHLFNGVDSLALISQGKTNQIGEASLTQEAHHQGTKDLREKLGGAITLISD